MAGDASLELLLKDMPSDPHEALAHYERRLRAQNEHLEQLHEDLHLARELQHALLPLQYPTFPSHATPQDSAFSFHHAYRANEAIGGDFFAILPLSETVAGVFLCDVMGHGVRAALVTAMIRAVLEELKPLAHEPGQLLNELNRALSEILRRARTPIFTSAFYLVADSTNGTMRYSNAGHPIPLHTSRRNQTVHELDCQASSGPALGMIEDADYSTRAMQLTEGDVVFLFTDGLFEIERADGEFFGGERIAQGLQKRITQMAQTPLAVLCDGVLQDAVDFAGKMDDDLCFVALELSRLGVRHEVGRDGVTGLYNAIFLKESMEREVSRAERKGYQVGVIALDLLGLDDYASQHGQGATDELLREFGALLHRCTRRSDIACRVRPTGFTLVLPEASIASTERKAAQIRSWVQAQGHAYFEDGQLSLALGLASFPQHGNTAQAIVQAATEAMKPRR
ncbi:MAG TPA: SpoIIE family protein phosphatase [Abditibacteriaceae bacterium]|jgi:diguanylate cyclase (GGDEF)-like protein